MAKLQYTFKTDTMLKLLFVRHRDLLMQLVATLLGNWIQGTCFFFGFRFSGRRPRRSWQK